LFCLATVIAVTRLAIAVTVSGILSIAFSSNLSQSSLFNFLTSFPYLDYIISRYTEKVKHFDEVFLNFFKKIDLIQRSGSWRDTLQCKLLELNCSLLNYTGKGEYENEYEDEYDLKK